MAGKNHHHIWQLLQRGFGKKLYGDHHIWEYKKGIAPKQTVTRTYGREKFFYGPEGSAADTNITEFENSVQGFIQNARNAEDKSELDPKILASIIAHLEMRSLFLREQMSNLGERLVSTLKGYIASEEHATKLFSAYIKNHPEIVEEALDERGIQGEQRRIANIVAEQLLPNATKQGAKEVAKLAKTLFEPLLDGIAETAMNAHVESLETSFTETSRTEIHLSREYFVHRMNNTELILPDTTLAFLMKSGCAPFSQKGDQIEQVILPISSDVAIIGRNKGTTDRGDGTLNRILASCAFEAFIAKENQEDFTRLANRIGRNAHVIKDSELKKMLSFNQLLKL